MKPKELIENRDSLFNKGSANELAELYHSDAINHQVANEPVNGKEVDLELTFEPPWDQDMMSEEAKLDLGLL